MLAAQDALEEVLRCRFRVDGSLLKSWSKIRRKKRKKKESAASWLFGREMIVGGESSGTVYGTRAMNVES